MQFSFNVICLQIRQRILCSAFLRAIKDPFPPARQSGIIGMAITQNLFTLADLSQKLMPPLCSMIMDPEKSVRDQVKSVMDTLLRGVTLIWKETFVNPSPAEPVYVWLCKQCRSRSVGF